IGVAVLEGEVGVQRALGREGRRLRVAREQLEVLGALRALRLQLGRRVVVTLLHGLRDAHGLLRALPARVGRVARAIRPGGRFRALLGMACRRRNGDGERAYYRKAGEYRPDSLEHLVLPCRCAPSPGSAIA